MLWPERLPKSPPAPMAISNCWNGENRTAVRLGKIGEFLDALAEATAEKPARTDGNKRLLNLVTGAQGVGLRIKEGVYTLPEVRPGISEEGGAQGKRQNDKQNMPPSGAGRQKHGQPRHNNDQESVGVGLFQKHSSTKGEQNHER